MNPRAYLDVRTTVHGDFMEPFVPNQTLINSSELRLPLAQATPRVLIGGEHGELYTLVMINPDVPNPKKPSMREIVSWIVTNIPNGTQSAQGIHRNIMLLYKQKSPLNGIESRVCFKSSDFANVDNLEKLVGISYFYARRQNRRNG